jgi:hypothetical protein
MSRLSLLALLACLCAAFAVAPQTAAADQPPAGSSIGADQATTIARATPAVRELAGQHHDLALKATFVPGAYWHVAVSSSGRGVAEVVVTPTGHVKDVFTGLKATSYLARGQMDPVFRHPWVWGSFAILFLLPFGDPRRLRRLLHLDLLVLLSFAVSWQLMAAAKADAAVWCFYPPLLYVLGRLLFAGLRPRSRRGRLVPLLPTAALLVGVVALFGARVALNVAHPEAVMDIGVASVVGADRIVHKEQLYVDNDQHGDTYGPFNYIAYIPFEMAFPYREVVDAMWAAHAAAIFFDLMALLGLFMLGRRMRAGPEGRRLGLALAWAWAAYPFTLFGVMNSTNDGLVAALVIWMLVAFARPAVRGALLGLAAAAKFFPGALVLVVARGRGDEGRRAWLVSAATCVGIVAFAFLIYLPPGGVRELWACTLGYQFSRPADLSAWALIPDFAWVQRLFEGLGLALAAGLAVLPARRTLGQVAALAGAIAVAFQIPTGHWFYFYIMWFAPFALVALFAEHVPAAAAAAAGADDRDAALDARPPLALAA